MSINNSFQGKFTETGAGKSKKLAKRQAANKMIQRLRDERDTRSRREYRSRSREYDRRY